MHMISLELSLEPHAHDRHVTPRHRTRTYDVGAGSIGRHPLRPSARLLRARCRHTACTPHSDTRYVGEGNSQAFNSRPTQRRE